MASGAWCVLDGALLPLDEARLSVLDRGWTLADGCFETMRVERRRVRWLADHRARLQAALEALEIAPPPLVRSLPEHVAALCQAAGLDSGMARLTISRGPSAERGLGAQADRPSAALTLAPLSPLPAAPAARRLVIARSTRRNQWSPLSRFKATAAYADQRLALREAQQRGAEDALLLNAAGAVACATTANLWLVRGAALLTPPLDDGAMPGIVRRHLLAAAPELGLTPLVAGIQPDDLFEADELLLTNVGVGVQAIAELDGAPFPPGPVAQRVLEWFGGV